MLCFGIPAHSSEIRVWKGLRLSISSSKEPAEVMQLTKAKEERDSLKGLCVRRLGLFIGDIYRLFISFAVLAAWAVGIKSAHELKVQ